ncbi:MAG: DNA polymerase III subunit gamma/tau, partial [Bacteroidia bacterium]|nr:DNA polymerase III subunit gamma/tau [Bacteroidia bacterium]
PRGVGKTTSARILAKVLNCENLQEGFKACGECNSCKAFVDNASFNIFELDAASNNSVDHIRALNEQVRFQPQQGSFKIYIIDEVHMLSQAAFNAFLKTLEEPPPYAKFILATTEKHKIIPTILSRCQIFDFRRIQIPDIVRQLEFISGQEKRNIDQEALHLIAQKADGALRDALSIYDKIISTVEGDITYKDVADNLNVLDYDYYFRIIDSAIKEDFPSLMLIYDKIVKSGFEPEQFIPGLMKHIRDLLMVRDLKTAALLETGDNLKKRYEDQAQLSSASFLMTALSILNNADINLIRSHNKRLSVEIALSKMCYMNRAIEKKKTVVQTEKKEILKEKEVVIQDNPKESIAKISSSEAVQNPAKVTNPASEKDHKEEKEEEKQPAAATVKPVIEKIDAPQISANLDSLLKSIEKEENDKAGNGIPYNVERIQKIFDEFRDNTESQSLKTAMKYIKVRIDDNTVTIITPTRIYIDFLKQEIHLLEKIHDQYPNRDIKLLFEVNEKTFPEYEPPKKPKSLTTKEKYDLLVSKNPEFEKLVDALKMKISNK